MTISNRNAGFTLVEMMAVVAILGILTAIALPSFRTLIASNRLSTSVNELLAATMTARSEALKRGKQIVLCTSSNEASCNNNGSWSEGWIVFVDDNADGARDTTSAAEVLLRVGSSMTGVTVSSSTDADKSHSIPFNSRGGLSTNGKIVLCIAGQAERVLSFSAAGRTGISKGGVCS